MEQKSFTIGGVTVGIKMLIALAVIIVAVNSTLWFYGYVNGLRSEGVQRETQLSAQYQSNQNYLSSYISGFYEMLGVAKVKTDKLDQILTDTLKARYVGDDGKGGFSSNGALFSAIREAYPDLSGLNIYDKIADYIVAQRAGYRNIQDKLLDMLRSYDSWRGDGFVQSRIVSGMLDIPSERLEARLPSGTLTGKEARTKMYQIVLASNAAKAYETGTMEPLQAPIGK